MRHELGHALTLHHEHASPNSKCEDEFLWDDVVYPALAEPPNNWSKEEVDAQLRRLTRTERLRMTEYDPLSIMHYEIPVTWLKSGLSSPCYVTGNTAISATDSEAVAAVYPETQQQQQEYLLRLGGVAKHLARELGIDRSTADAMEEAIGEALPAPLRGRGLVPNIQQCVVSGDIEGNVRVDINIGTGRGCVVEFVR